MKLRTLVLAVGLIGAGAAQATTYTYIGSFTTDGSTITYADGSSTSNIASYWGNNPAVYSGLEAAALLFGGSASDYALSTVNTSVNNLAWYDGWGDHIGHQYADTYKLDLTGLGYNGCSISGVDCSYSAYSAYISDGFSATNYVYKVAAVPEPESFAMFMAGLGLLGAITRRKQK